MPHEVVMQVPGCVESQMYPQDAGQSDTKHLGDLLHSLASRKECKMLEGHLHPDHIYILMSIPPIYFIAQVIGLIKGKIVIHIALMCLGWKKYITGMHSWTRLFCLNSWH